MDLTVLLLAFGLGGVSLAVLAGAYGFKPYNSGETQVKKNLRHREKMRARQLARDR